MAPKSANGFAASVIDLFAGSGGFTQGFAQAGFSPVFAVESDTSAAATYEENFGNHLYVGDIRSLDLGALPVADVVIGGPPCQGFSQLGNRKRSDPINRLWMDFVRVVEVVRPSLFVLENVPQFLKTRRLALLRGMTKAGGRLEEYSLVHAVLNAADFGVPQRRKRAVIIGSRIGEPRLPTRTHGLEGGEEWVGLREALAGIPFEVPSTALPERARENGVPGPFKATEIHVGRNPTDLSLRRYDQVPPGGNRFDLERNLLPPCWLDRESGSTDVMGRLEWDKPALTIRTEFFKPEKGRYLHPQWDPDDRSRRVNRSLTHWEAARIQGFPDDFVWCGRKTEIARQIGNAVPVGLAKAVAEEVAKALP